MAMFVVKSIHIQINGQVMDLSIASGACTCDDPTTCPAGQHLDNGACQTCSAGK